MHDANADDLLFTTEVSRILSVSAETVRSWERRGILPALRTAAGVRLFKRSDVEDVARKRERRTHAVAAA